MNSNIRMTLRCNKNSSGMVKHYEAVAEGRVIASQSATTREMAANFLKRNDRVIAFQKAAQTHSGVKVVLMF